MREPSFLVLAARGQHGYALMQSIQDSLGQEGTIRAGTLYAALDRLAGEGLIVESGQEVVDGRTRRYYDLTEQGTAALTAETARLQARVTLAQRGLKLRGAIA
jgi:DNA-binding PadR family transcriptional regulator